MKNPQKCLSLFLSFKPFTMKKILVLLAALPLLVSCTLDGIIDGMFEEATTISPTISGFSYSKDGTCSLSDSDAESAFTAFIIAESKFGSQTIGKTVKCQVQLNGNKYTGKRDKLDIYTFQEGKLTWVSGGANITMDGDYTALNGLWEITVTENGDKVSMKSGSKQLNLKFWHETD